MADCTNSFHTFSSEIKIEPSLDDSKQILCICILMSIFTSLNPINKNYNKSKFSIHQNYPFPSFHLFLILTSLIPSVFSSFFLLSSLPP